MEILQNLNFIFVLLSFLVCLTTALPNIVTLKVRGVDCTDTCFYNEDENECYSSIKVNEQEKSLQKNGLNVVVIDTATGRVKQKYFSYLGTSSKQKAFRRFFKNIHDGSVVVIVSQNMCNLYYPDWYIYLTRNTKIFRKGVWKGGAQVGVAIGCVGDCPSMLDGTLPYGYFGYNGGHEKLFSFRLKSLPTTTTQPTTRKVTTSTNSLATNAPTQAKTKNDTSLIIGIVLTVAILAIVAFLVIIWLRVKKGKDVCKICMVCLTSCTENKNSNNNTEDEKESGSVKLFNNESYGIQANVLSLKPVTQPRNREKNCRLQTEYQNTKNEYQAVTEKNVEYSRVGAATEINEYAYIDPKKDKNLTADNNYYMPGRSEINYLEDLDGSSQACDHTNYEIAKNHDDCSENTLYEKPLINQEFNPFSSKQQNMEKGKSNFDTKNSHLYNTPSVYQPLSGHTDMENMYETVNNPQ